MKLSLSKERAQELGLLTCKCGHAQREHYPHSRSGKASCPNCACLNYQETLARGIEVLED